MRLFFRQRVTPKEERRALIEDLDKDVDESESDAETTKNNREQRHLHPQMPSPFNNASQERDLALKMESCLKVIDDEDDGVDVIDAVEQCNRGNGVNVRKQGEGKRHVCVVEEQKNISVTFRSIRLRSMSVSISHHSVEFERTSIPRRFLRRWEPTAGGL